MNRTDRALVLLILLAGLAVLVYVWLTLPKDENEKGRLMGCSETFLNKRAAYS